MNSKLKQNQKINLRNFLKLMNDDVFGKLWKM